MKNYNRDNPPIFIGGEGRSGTTLMRVILNSHPNIACGPESQLFRDKKVEELYDYLLHTYFDRISDYSEEPDKYLAGSFRAMIDGFFEPYMLEQGKKRWAEKSPHNIVSIDFLLKVYEKDLKFIHMIRDGRDVVSSILSMDWGPDNVTDAATRWSSIIENSLKHRGEPYYMEVKYEDLADNPEKIVREVCEFIGEEFDEQMLAYHKADQHLGSNESSNSQVAKPIYKSSIGRWKTDLDQIQLHKFYEIAGKRLSELGYE
ncbi:sulfotransferase [Candidatus Dojkabacteria bacterium]|uniref:Sulfotransferase n=1 Tax=Candidatus Dojkabacteria bacterium TaxID=2099670 RepID=A0A955KWU0_9BACT|nr:sulfotransferase [Candidatus Dojkabacteria bacterium]